MSALLAAVAVIALAGCLWDVAGAHDPGRIGRRLRGWVRGSQGVVAARPSSAERLLRAGLADRVSPAAFTAAKLAGGAGGGLAALLVAGSAPGRMLPLVIGLLVVAGYVTPDALAERAARHRRARIEAALPDALDLLAVGIAAGRSPFAVLAGLAPAARGPLAEELGRLIGEVEAGTPRRDALAELGRRCATPAVSDLVAALERSRRFGSPLAEQLHDHATGLRRDERRRIEEQAARAAPKIQLVVALVLVPSALLAIAAGLIAHADSLVGGL